MCEFSANTKVVDLPHWRSEIPSFEMRTAADLKGPFQHVNLQRWEAEDILLTNGSLKL
jgi:hypothetical protein